MTLAQVDKRMLGFQREAVVRSHDSTHQADDVAIVETACFLWSGRSELWDAANHQLSVILAMPADSEQPITLWIKQLQEHADDDAQTQLWNTYFQRLITYARSRLHAGQRRVQDEEDVALSVMESFFSGARQGRFPDLRDRDNLWPLLVTMTARKVANQVRDGRAIKRGRGTVRGNSAFGNLTDPQSPANIDNVAGYEPTPEFAVSVAESCQTLLEILENPTLAQVAQLKLEGYTNLEISEQLNCSPRTVERHLKSIRDRWALHDIQINDSQ